MDEATRSLASALRRRRFLGVAVYEDNVLVNSGSADTIGAGAPDGGDEPTWNTVTIDPILSKPPAPGSQGNVPAGQDLRLDIGWARFEQLMVAVAQEILGLNQVQFRRYGTSGQAQHGASMAQV